MQQSTTYRKLVSAALLLLYIFIATPVQLWHQHRYAVKDKAAAVKIAAVKPGTHAEDCKICQHTYAAYLTDNVIYSISVPFAFPVYHSGTLLRFSSPAPEDTSNKSPPVTG